MHCSANTTGDNTAVFLGYLGPVKQHYPLTLNVPSSEMMNTAGVRMASLILKEVVMLS